VKSRLNVVHGFDGVLSVFGSGRGDNADTETWIVEDVSAGGFGAGIPKLKGEWLKIGCLLGLQPRAATPGYSA